MPFFCENRYYTRFGCIAIHRQLHYGVEIQSKRVELLNVLLCVCCFAVFLILTGWNQCDEEGNERNRKQFISHAMNVHVFILEFDLEFNLNLFAKMLLHWFKRECHCWWAGRTIIGTEHFDIVLLIYKMRKSTQKSRAKANSNLGIKSSNEEIRRLHRNEQGISSCCVEHLSMNVSVCDVEKKYTKNWKWELSELLLTQ